MQKKYKKVALLWFVFVCISPFSVLAEDGVIELCSAMAEDSAYEGDDEDFKKIIAGKNGWIFRTEADLKQTREDFILSDRAFNAFLRLKKAFKYNGTELALAVIPTRGLVGYPYLLPPYDKSYDYLLAKAEYKNLLDRLKSTGVIVADTSEVDAKTIPEFFLTRDNHWTAIGARYVAQKMAEAIKADPVYEQLKKVEYETTSSKPNEDLDANYNFLDFIEKICGTKVEREKITQIYTTSPKSTDNLQQELLGDAEKTEVVLIGTSNSTEPQPSYANFAGFLKQHLGVDVFNDSIKGGSMRGAMSNYVLNGDFNRNKPKLVIWELSANYGFEQRNFFREIIPAVYGMCSDETAIAASNGQINPDETVIFSDLSQKAMISNKYYLALELEDKEMREINVEFLHMGRDKPNTMKFARSMRNFPINSGVYYAELKHDTEEPLESIKLITKNGKGAYKAKMCEVPN